MLLLMVFFAIFYFMVLRPQNKARKEHASFLAGLKKGDRVFTEGGVLGTVHKVADNTVTLDLGEKVKVTFLKSSLGGAFGDESSKEQK